LRNKQRGIAACANSLRTPHSALRTSTAFTLLELIIVITIMGVLAAFLLYGGATVKRNALVKKTQTELAQLETAIDRYKAAYGFYPPDNPCNIFINQLYFELLGTTNTTPSLSTPTYQLLNDSSLQLIGGPGGTLSIAFGSNACALVTGFMNCSKSGAGEDTPLARNFLTNLKPNQILAYSNNTILIKMLVGSVGWQGSPETAPLPGAPTFNPWRYNSSSATNNPGAYDLWIDISLSGKSYRISNWSRQPKIVP